MTFRSEHDNKDRTQRPPFIKILIGKYKFKCVVTGHNVTSTTKEQRNKIRQSSSLFSFIQRFLTEAQCVMEEGQGSLQEVESSCQEQGGERGGAVQGRGGVTAVLAAVTLLPVHSVLQHTPVTHLQTG